MRVRCFSNLLQPTCPPSTTAAPGADNAKLQQKNSGTSTAPTIPSAAMQPFPLLFAWLIAWFLTVWEPMVRLRRFMWVEVCLCSTVENMRG